jgi:ComF family protein
MLQRMMKDCTALFFPGECGCCDGPLVGSGLVPVCSACVARVTPDLLFGCARCGDALNLDLDLEDVRFAGMLAEGFLCHACRMVPPAFERAVAYGTYRGEMRMLLRLLKFRRIPGVARLLGDRMADAMLKVQPEAAGNMLVAAVPLFQRRERQRGFNQSVLLADRALARLRRTHPAWKLERAHALLVRQRSTHSQFELGARDRRRNLLGAFRVQGDVRGREVMLVDDILTTGATARECARVLIAAGAGKVWVVTLARAQREFLRRQHEDPGEYVAAWDLPASTAS